MARQNLLDHAGARPRHTNNKYCCVIRDLAAGGTVSEILFAVGVDDLIHGVFVRRDIVAQEIVIEPIACGEVFKRSVEVAAIRVSFPKCKLKLDLVRG